MLTKSQQNIVNFLLEHDKALVWADAGSGKTLAILAYLKQVAVATILIVVPKQVLDKDVWGKEVRKWGVSGFRVEVVNYEGYSKLLLTEYDIIIFDEAHRLKARTTQSTSGGSARAYKWRELAKRTKRVIGLTGTPSNDVADMYYVFKNLDISVPGFIDTSIVNTKESDAELELFALTACTSKRVVTPYGLKISNPQIKKEFRPWFMDLLSQAAIRVFYNFPYDEVYLEFTAPLDPRVKNLQLGYTQDGLGTSTVFEAVGKLQQAANGFIYEDILDVNDNIKQEIHRLDNYKEQILSNFLSKLEDLKCILVYKFKFDRDILERYARPGDIVLSIKQSEGVNYQEEGFSTMYFHNPDYSVIDMKQMIARVARKGQTRKVTIYYAIRKNSVDEKTLKLLAGKGEIYDLVK